MTNKNAILKTYSKIYDKYKKFYKKKFKNMISSRIQITEESMRYYASAIFILVMLIITVQLVSAQQQCPEGQEPGFGGVGCIPIVEGGPVEINEMIVFPSVPSSYDWDNVAELKTFISETLYAEANALPYGDKFWEGRAIIKEYFNQISEYAGTDHASGGSKIVAKLLEAEQKQKACRMRCGIDIACEDQCDSTYLADRNKIYEDYYNYVKQIGKAAFNSIDKLKASQAQPTAVEPTQIEPTNIQSTPISAGTHPLIDFVSSFQPLQLSDYQLSLIQSEMQSYSSRCGKTKTADCRQNAHDIMASSQAAFQLQEIAIADDPKVIGAWESAQEVDWAGPEIVDLANLHMDNGDQAGAAVLTGYMIESSKTSKEVFQSIIDDSIKEWINEHKEENREAAELARMAEKNEIMHSVMYNAVSYDLSMAVWDFSEAHMEMFRLTKAMMLANKETASQIFRVLTGGLSEPFILPMQAVKQQEGS